MRFPSDIRAICLQDGQFVLTYRWSSPELHRLPFRHSHQYNTRVRPRFEIIEHPADVGFIACGASLPELFESSALALASLACSLKEITEREEVPISTTGSDVEALLYAWLAEILAVADAAHLVFGRFAVTHLAPAPGSAQGLVVRGKAFGETYQKARHCAGTYIKAVTYHQLRVQQTQEGSWQAQVYLDV